MQDGYLDQHTASSLLSAIKLNDAVLGKKNLDGKDNYERGRLAIRDFAESAKTLLPDIREEDLQLGYSGLRPKLVPPTGHGIADFVITRDPKVPQAIHLVGMESPGLTAASAVAEYVLPLIAETI